MTKENSVILYSGHKRDRHEFGTGFHISRHVIDSLFDFEPVNERICKIRVKFKYYNFTFYINKPQPMEKINTLRTGLLNCLNTRSRGLSFRHRASCI